MNITPEALARLTARGRSGVTQAGPFMLNLFVRLAAMCGKFVFLLIGARAMAPDDYGRVGIVLATALIVVAVVGLEGYQTLVRRIVQSGGDDQAKVRAFYLRFAAQGAAVSGLVAFAIFSAYGWQLSLALLAATVVGCEHLNIEICRMLITEGRATLSIAATSARTGLWAIALPAVSLAGLIPFDWNAYLVLGAWLSCSIAGMFCILPIRRIYAAVPVTRDDYRVLYRGLFRASAIWVVAAAAWRILENGGRLVVGFYLGDAASGRFTLISTIASFGLVTAKGLVEPIYFPRIVGADGARELVRFARATKLLVASSAGASLAMVLVYNSFGGREITGSEWAVLGAVLVACSALAMSQIPHFALYRTGRDKEILWCNVGAGALGLMAASLLTASDGMVGTGIGLALGSLGLWGMKEYARQRTPSGIALGDPVEAIGR